MTISPLAIRTATEPRRLQILQMIWQRERNVGQIAARLPVSVGAVSQHLTKLRASGLVTVRIEGRRRFYRAAREEMGPLAGVLEAFWTDRLQSLKQMAEAAEEERRVARPPQRPRNRRQKWKTIPR